MAVDQILSLDPTDMLDWVTLSCGGLSWLWWMFISIRGLRSSDVISNPPTSRADYLSDGGHVRSLLPLNSVCSSVSQSILARTLLAVHVTLSYKNVQVSLLPS